MRRLTGRSSRSAIVVLINGGSASDRNCCWRITRSRAVLIGTPSFGKARPNNLSARERIRAQTAHTNGRSIQATGINQRFRYPKEALIETDTRIREADLPKHLEMSASNLEAVTKSSIS